MNGAIPKYVKPTRAIPPPPCDCISYNRPDFGPHDGRQEVVLAAPAHIQGRPNGICVDACIVNAIKMLWSHQVITMGCCCGHNRVNPSLVIAEHEDAERVKKMLSENDDRQWEVMQWRLVKC